MTLALALLPMGCGDDEVGTDPSTGTGTGTGPTTESQGTSTEGPVVDDTSSESSSGASDSTGHEPPPGFHGLEACLEQLVTGREPSGAAASVVLGDEIVWAKGLGTRHPDEGGLVDENTRFRVGSVTKTMTAITALALVDDGSLDLDAPLGELLPPFGDPMHPEWTAALTTRLLLSHQAAFMDIFEYIDPDGPREDEALAEAVLGDVWTHVPFLVEPGTMWNYSNANYSVAGVVVETTSGLPYREAVAQRLFAPLGMVRSSFDVEEVEADGNYARGVLGEVVYEATDYDHAWGRPSGYAWSSAVDLGLLARLLLHGDASVLSPDAHELLLTPEVDTRVFLDRMSYGLGLFHRDFIPTPDGFIELDIIEHGGFIHGYTSHVLVVPELDFGIALVGNAMHMSFYPCVAAALGDLPGVQLEPVVPDTQAELTHLGDYVGDYIEPVGVTGDFSISQTVTGLRVSFPELDALAIPYEHALTLVSLDNFIISIQGVDIALTGIRGDDGSVEYLRTRYFVGQRAS